MTDLERYWQDRDYRRRVDTETAHANQIRQNEIDRAQILRGNRFPKDWSPQDKLDAVHKITGQFADGEQASEWWLNDPEFIEWHNENNPPYTEIAQ